MKDTTHEDAEMLARIASVVGRLDLAGCLRLLGYAKGLALAGTAGPACRDSIRANTLEEVFGVCDAYSIDGYPAADLMLELFQEHGEMDHADIHGFMKLKPWEKMTKDLEAGQ